MQSLGNPKADLMVSLAREQHTASVIARINACMTKCAERDRFMHLCGLENTGFMALSALTMRIPTMTPA